MVGIERERDDDGQDIIDILARFYLGEIKMEDQSDENQKVLRMCFSIMQSDKKFRNDVYKRRDELIDIRKNGIKIPLYTKFELAKAKRHKKKKATSYQKVFQPSLFGNSINNELTIGVDSILDPERKISQLHSELQGRYSWDRSKLIKEEVRQNKIKLKKLIGLSDSDSGVVIRNTFPKLIVRKIMDDDIFGIVNEYDRVLVEPSEDLLFKINQVRGLIDIIKDPELSSRDKNNIFNEFNKNFNENFELG